MYFLYLFNFVFITYCIYTRYFKIPELPPLGDNKRTDVLDLELNTITKINLKTEEIEEYSLLDYENENIKINSSDEYILVEYTMIIENEINDELVEKSENYSIIYKNNKTMLVPYEPTGINKYVFRNKLKCAKIIVDESSVDVTEYIEQFLGPNNNFHVDVLPTEEDLKVRDLVKVGHLIGPIKNVPHILVNGILSENYVLYTEDALGVKNYYDPGQLLTWKPDLTLS